MHLIEYYFKRAGTFLANLACAFIPGKAARNLVRDRFDPFSPPHVGRYVERYWTPAPVGTRPARTAPGKRYVFQCWWQGYDAAPPLVKNCIDSVRDHVPSGCEYIFITEENAREWSGIPDFIWNKFKAGAIDRTHMSDILRTYLLARHGGWWIDATYLATAPLPREWERSGLFMFQTVPPRAWTVIDSSLIYARPGSRILAAVRDMIANYWQSEARLMQYCLWHLMVLAAIRLDPAARAEFKSMPKISQRSAYRLEKMLGKKFDGDLFDKIAAATPLHKLTWKFPRMFLWSQGTFASKLSER